MFSAALALRTEHDPAQATALLKQYRRRYPDGVLLEEALGLAIEAAAQQESPSAAQLAADYLARFPQGRFRPAAERAQRRFGR